MSHGIHMSRGHLRISISRFDWPHNSHAKLVQLRTRKLLHAFSLNSLRSRNLLAFIRSFISGSNTSDTLKYYYLLVPVTLPATIIFVYLNWLSVSFFKTA